MNDGMHGIAYQLIADTHHDRYIHLINNPFPNHREVSTIKNETQNRLTSRQQYHHRNRSLLRLFHAGPFSCVGQQRRLWQ